MAGTLFTFLSKLEAAAILNELVALTLDGELKWKMYSTAIARRGDLLIAFGPPLFPYEDGRYLLCLSGSRTARWQVPASPLSHRLWGLVETRASEAQEAESPAMTADDLAAELRGMA